MITLDVSENPDKEWNDRLRKSCLGTIYQSKEMGIFYKKINTIPRFLQFKNSKDEIVGQLLLSISSRFKKKGLKGKFFQKSPFLKKKVFQWTYGPIVFDSNYKEKIYSVLGKHLISEKCRVVGWENPLSPSSISSLGKTFHNQKWCTFLIDLNKNIEDIFSNIDKHSGRKNIERSIKRGVTIEEINEKTLEDYNNLLKTMRPEIPEEETGFNRLFEWWRLFKPLGYSGFLAKKDNEIIGGLLFSFFCNHIIEGGLVRSTKDLNENLYSQDLIKWKIIEWGQKNNMKFYNLAGVNPNPQSKKEEGILRYKKKWGGVKYNYWKISI